MQGARLSEIQQNQFSYCYTTFHSIRAGFRQSSLLVNDILLPQESIRISEGSEPKTGVGRKSQRGLSQVEAGQRGELGNFDREQLVLKDKSSLSSCPPVPVHLPMARTPCSRAVLSDETEGHHLLQTATQPSEKHPFPPLPGGHLCISTIPTVEVEKGMGQDRAPESRDLEPPDDGNSYKMCCSLVTLTPPRLLRAAAWGAGTCRGGNRTPLLWPLQDSLNPCHHSWSCSEPGEVPGMAPCLTSCCVAVIPCLSTAISMWLICVI